jgi:hypothetical protein
VEANEEKNNYLRERRQNNQDERIWLQKLVDNGEQLDHADEAKMNQLVEAHQKNNNLELERQCNHQDERIWLQKLVDNGK